MSNPQSRCEFQDLPEATQVETPFGRMFVHHMFDSVNRSVRIDCTEGSGGFSPIVVNRVKMLASLRLTDYGKGGSYRAKTTTTLAATTATIITHCMRPAPKP